MTVIGLAGLYAANIPADVGGGGPPLVLAAIKEVQRERERLSFAEAMRRIGASELPTVAALYSSQDQLEGARAFAEKRRPVWKGY